MYFGRELQARVLRLFADSLYPAGFLGLGTQESLAFCNGEDMFEFFVKDEKIYRKKRG